MFDDSVHYHWISSGGSCHIKPLNLIQRLFGLSTVWRAHGLVKDDDMCCWTVCHADKVCTSTTSPSIISRHIPSPSSIPTHHRQLCQCCGFMSQFLGNWGIPCKIFWALFVGIIEWHFATKYYLLSVMYADHVIVEVRRSAMSTYEWGLYQQSTRCKTTTNMNTRRQQYYPPCALSFSIFFLLRNLSTSVGHLL